MTSAMPAGSATAPVAELGTVLGVWAHPDDEVYLSGGIMAAAVDSGARVVCVTATRGERARAIPAVWPPARLAARRDAELATSLAVAALTAQASQVRPLVESIGEAAFRAWVAEECFRDAPTGR